MEPYFIQREGYQIYTKQIIHDCNAINKPTLVFLHDSWGCVDMWGDFPDMLIE